MKSSQGTAMPRRSNKLTFRGPTHSPSSVFRHDTTCGLPGLYAQMYKAGTCGRMPGNSVCE